MMKNKIVEKYYSKDDKLFHIVKENEDYEKVETTYDNFKDFYIANNKNLKGANLLFYDFNENEFSKYNLKDSIISSKIMKKIGIYDDSVEKLLHNDEDLIDNSKFMEEKYIIVKQNSNIVNYIDYEDSVIGYISDLHLNYKINKIYNDAINKYELEEYLYSIVKQLKDSIPNCKKVINIFVGDISFNFEIFKIFFKLYRQEIPNIETICILGNHELWDKNLLNKYNSIDEIVNEYRKYLASLNSKVVLLENEMYFINSKKHIMGLNEILDLPKEKLRNLFNNNPFAIVGSIGYSGCNNQYNADSGIYNGTIVSRNIEKERSKMVESLYQKLLNDVPDKKIFFVTHMPKPDWTEIDYNKSWYYISGHTHKNVFDSINNIYADGQVGYNGNDFSFRYIPTIFNYDIFADYKDGIYKINRKQYKQFYKGHGKTIEFNWKYKYLYMVKKNNVYCFFIDIYGDGKIKILCGGNPNNLVNYDLKYYYDNLDNYSNSIKFYLEKYSNYQKFISNQIRKIGGNGTIHGCIIDIDYNSHLFVDPNNWEITPYYAYNIIEKYKYKNVKSLLIDKCKKLYLNYLTAINNINSENNGLLQLINIDAINDSNTIYVPDTNMYKVSRLLNNLQYLEQCKIIRKWSDKVISKSTIENGQIIVKDFLKISNDK